jgi:hypothetical protein
VAEVGVMRGDLAADGLMLKGMKGHGVALHSSCCGDYPPA